MKMSAEEYGRRVRRVGPPSPLGRDCLWAFGVGGGICLLGEVLRGWYLTMGLDKELAGTLTSCTLVALSALLTTLGLYQKLAAKAGAGTLVPITGFANAVVSAAIEFKTEGRVLGTGAKMFIIAGPVIVYGTLAEFAGCGATVPLLGFGHLLAKGVRTAIEEEGAIGILTGGLTAAAAGITTSLVCGVVCSWVG